MIPHAFFIDGVSPGRLAIVLRPRGGDWLNQDVAFWRRVGFDGIVSLLTPDEIADFELEGEKSLSEEHGIRFFQYPISDRGVPESADDYADLIAVLVSYLSTGATLGVHCRQGIGRAGLTASAILIGRDLDPDAAMRTVSTARGLPIPETLEQKTWLFENARRLRIPQTATLTNV